MLLIEKGECFYYTWIKDLSPLLYNQSKHRERKYFCKRCLTGYSRKDFLNNHKPDCQGFGQTAVRIEMPSEGKNKLKFEHYYKQQKAPYIIYADFEALTKKIEGAERNPNQSNTQNSQIHEACSYCYMVVRCDGETKPPVEYRGPNAAEHMLRSLMNEQDQILKTLANPKPMKMTQKDQLDCANSKDCHICDKSLIIPEFHAAKDLYDPNTGKHIGQVHRKSLFEELAEFIGPRVKPRGSNIKQENCLRCKETLTKKFYKDSVRDHCHITGQYRGAAHNACNLKLKICPKITQIPVVFHNLRGYDSHLIMQAISKIQETNEDEEYLKLSCIPHNTEKYISFNFGNLRFIDSIQFLLTSLDRLVAANKPETFQITAQYEPDEKKRIYLCAKVYIPMSIWTLGIDLRKQIFHQKRDSSVSLVIQA